MSGRTSAPARKSVNLDECRLLAGDCVQLLATFAASSVDLTLSDMPYGISLAEWDVLHSNTNSALGGQSPAQKTMGPRFKRRGKPINGWSKADLDRPKEYEDWCFSWATQLARVMRPGGSVLLFGGRRTIHRAIVAMENAGFMYRDMLCWAKPTAHFRAQSLSKLLVRRGMPEKAPHWEGWRLGNLSPVFEPIAWFFRPYKIGRTIVDNVLEFGVGAMNTAACSQNGKAPTNLLRFAFTKDDGKHHEAQKPVALLEHLLKLTTKEKQVVLDHFMGSGSTGVACVRQKRRFIGIEQDEAHFATASWRIAKERRHRTAGAAFESQPSCEIAPRYHRAASRVK